jgi:hypothetical protein
MFDARKDPNDLTPVDALDRRLVDPPVDEPTTIIEPFNHVTQNDIDDLVGIALSLLYAFRKSNAGVVTIDVKRSDGFRIVRVSVPVKGEGEKS